MLEKTQRYFIDLFHHDKAGFWTMAFTAVLTVFTGLLVCVTKSTDETMRITQRPWLAVIDSCIARTSEVRWNKCRDEGLPAIDFKTLKAGDDLTWRIMVKNTGHSPAMDASLKAAHCIVFTSDDKPPDFSTCMDQIQEMPKRPVFPDADPFIAVGNSFTFTEQSARDIKNGARFFITAKAEYSEWREAGKGRRHTASICMTNEPNGPTNV